MADGVLKQITELDELNRGALKERWRALFGTEPPRYSRQLLIGRLAYRIQKLAYRGFSGGTLDRPALQRLLADVDRGQIDCVVVYKVDRLSRSLLDFTKIVETFGRRGVSFVSVTQQFNTTTSMGRLTLNILLSFAQFEREITGERIRDKVAAAKRKGKYTGGLPILGYDVDRQAKRLVANPEEAKLVRRIFERFCELGSTTKLAAELNAQGERTKAWTTLKGTIQGGRPWNKAHLYRLLNNRKYVGEIEHKGTVYSGEHEAIVSRALWDAAHQILAENYRVRANRTRARTPALLKGLLRCGHCDWAMGITFTRKKGKTYRYYLCVQASKRGYKTCPVRNIAAGMIEEAVVKQLRILLRSGDFLASSELDLDPPAVAALGRVEATWDRLFPGEQERLVRRLVAGIEVKADGLDLQVGVDGLRALADEISVETNVEAAG